IRASTYYLVLSVHHFLITKEPSFLAHFNEMLNKVTRQAAGYIELETEKTYPEARQEVAKAEEIQAGVDRIRGIAGDLFKVFSTTGAIDTHLMDSLEAEAYGIQENADRINEIHRQKTASLVETSKARVSFLFGLYVVFFLLGFILLLLVNMVVLRYVAWPVKKLAGATVDLARGNLQRRVAIGSEDEIGTLAQSFNEMAERLEDHDRRQRDFSQVLERRVKERTRELEQTTEHLRATQDRLVRARKQALMGSLAAAVTHEVRTPLNALAINFQILQRELQGRKEADDTAIAESLSTIDAEITRVNQVLEDFVAYARFPEPRFHEIDINTQAQQVARFMAPEASSAGVAFEVDLHPEVLPLVADEDQMRQLLINLCANAIQAMPDGGTLRLSTEPVESVDGRGSGVRISVADQGIGIPPDAIEGIFEPFYSTKDGGLGLGLAIVGRIVDQHHGEIVCRSVEGRGTTFEVLLPADHSGMDRFPPEVS
ncbi:MAG: ATP-binding protein, partial [Nitrospinota bacterium]